MLPNLPSQPMPMGGGGAPPPGGRAMPAGAPPIAREGGEEGGASPEQVRVAIMSVLQRVKMLADRYGLDLAELVASLGQAPRAAAPPPPPPSAPPTPIG